LRGGEGCGRLRKRDMAGKKQWPLPRPRFVREARQREKGPPMTTKKGEGTRRAAPAPTKRRRKGREKKRRWRKEQVF